MLVDFSIENYGPFKEQVILSMLKSKGDEFQRNLFHSDAINRDVLKTLSVFGPNASGKTYLFKAFSELYRLVCEPAPANDRIKGYNPFRFSPETRYAPTTFRMRYVESWVLYDYSVSYTSEKICSESLSYYPKGQKVKVFERACKNKNVINLDKGFDMGIEIKTNRNIPNLIGLKKRVNPQSTFLSVAAMFNHKICLLAHRGIVSQNNVISPGESNYLDALVDRIDDDPEYKAGLLNALKIADTGIIDIRTAGGQDSCGHLDVAPKFFKKYPHDDVRSSKFLLIKHDVNVEELSESDRCLPLEMESDGTIQLLNIMMPLMDVLRDGGVLLIDGFGSAFHHDICKWIVRLFNNSYSNPKNAQLIVNTHNQLIMDSCQLRRDQICFVEKNMDDCISTVYSLGDMKNVRKSCSLQKSYEFGRFGANPFIPGDDAIW